MILKKDSKKIEKKKFFNVFLRLYFFLTFAVAFLFIIFFITSHKVHTTTYKILDHLSKAGRIQYIHIFEIAFAALKSPFYDIDKIDFEIDFDNIVTIENDRKKAIENKHLGLKDNLSKVRAVIKHNGESSRARIRLKGDRQLHFNKKKHSSYNVYLPRGKYIYGVKNFGIHKPGIRNYIHEWIFIEMTGDFEMIKPKYSFFNLFINGESQGLYAFEEKMGKEVVERNQRRSGPIFSLKDEYNMVPKSDTIFQIYNEKYWYKDENIEIAKIARKKLTDFYDGKRSVESTFDIEKFAALFAIFDLTYTYHGLFPSSNYYYNPLSGLFEPIPRDGHRMLPNYSKFNKNYYKQTIFDAVYFTKDFIFKGGKSQIPEYKIEQLKRFFYKNNGEINYEFQNLYIKYLKEISSEDYIKNFFKKRKKEINKINSHIYSDHFWYSSSQGYTWGLYFFDKKDLFQRAKVIRKRLASDDIVMSLKIDDDKFINLDVIYARSKSLNRNDRFAHLILKEFNCIDTNNNQVKLKIDRTIDLPNKKKFDFSSYNKQDLNCISANIYDNINDKFFLVEVDKINSYSSFKDFKISEDNKLYKYFKNIENTLYLKTPNVIIEENLFIPRGFNVQINQNENIILKNNAFIISESPWKIEGDKENPVNISGTPDNFGGGIFISDNSKLSKFNNVNFSFLSGFNKSYLGKTGNQRYQTIAYYSGEQKNTYKQKIYKIDNKFYEKEYLIMGAVNFYKTNVQLSNVYFNKIFAEDAINLISSNFTIEKAFFDETASDSIDFDFSNGVIKSSKFSNIGNDAIDFSGSLVTASNLTFNNVNDKLISVGENSKVEINNVNGVNSFIGITSKDGSVVTANNISLEKVQIPFASFNKKFEYETANMKLNDIKVSGYYEKWITDKKSKIFYKNKRVGKVTKKINDAIYNKDLSLIK